MTSAFVLHQGRCDLTVTEWLLQSSCSSQSLLTTSFSMLVKCHRQISQMKWEAFPDVPLPLHRHRQSWMWSCCKAYLWTSNHFISSTEENASWEKKWDLEISFGLLNTVSKPLKMSFTSTLESVLMNSYRINYTYKYWAQDYIQELPACAVHTVRIHGHRSHLAFLYFYGRWMYTRAGLNTIWVFWAFHFFQQKIK